jgi:general secretion pathway protein J
VDKLRVARRGFTLIELLVAITILAVVAVLGWRGLDGIVRARIALTENLDQTRAMQLTFAQLQTDCARIATSTQLPNHQAVLASDTRLIMIRAVYAEDQPPRLQVVTYRLQDDALSRRESIPTRDLVTLDADWQAAAGDTDATRALILQSKLTSMILRLWPQDGSAWQTPKDYASTPAAPVNGLPAPTGPATPTGIEVVLQVKGRNVSMVKIFLVGAA